MNRYPAYKPSGVDWLGQIPMHWEMPRIKLAAPLQNKKSGEKSVDIPYIPLEFIESRSGRLLEVGNTAKVESIVNLFETNDVLFNKLRPYLAKVVLAPFNGSCSSELLVLRPNDKLVPKFSFYYLISDPVIKVVDSFTYGAKMPRANSTQIADLPLVIPPIEEQRAIVAFLDGQTAVLDSLIAEKQALIRLLQEKRAAVIGTAVTQGLDPTVPMKDSGVEWIGRIPAHWEIKSFKRVTSRVVVGIAEAATHAYADNGVPIIRSTNVRLNRLLTDDIFHIDQSFADKNRSKYIFAGDIVTVRTGNAGVSAVIPDWLDQSQCFTLLISTPLSKQNAKYYCYLLNSDVGQVPFKLEGWGTAQVNISVPILQNVPVIEPSIDEQNKIVNHIEEETAQLDELITETEASIATLQEYRAALIASAVTGQIDVRGYAAP